MLLDLTSIVELAGAGGLAAAAAWALFQRCYVAVPPNQALVLFGRRSSRSAGREAPRAAGVLAREPRVLVGGGAVLAPWNKAFAYLSLAPIDVEATVRAVHSISAGSAAGWEVTLAVQAKVATEAEALRLAAQELFGMSPTELGTFVRRAVEASVPPVLARLRIGDEEPDWDRLGAEIQATVAPELVPSGLVVRSVQVRELRRLASGQGPLSSGEERARVAAGLGSPRTADGAEARLRRIELGLRAIGSRLESLEPASASLEPLTLYPTALDDGPSPGDGSFDDSTEDGRPGRARPPPSAARARTVGEGASSSDAEHRR